jgi:hypothetical protein
LLWLTLAVPGLFCVMKLACKLAEELTENKGYHTLLVGHANATHIRVETSLTAWLTAYQGSTRGK